MTNDEKAKAYDEALELARKIHSGEGVDAAAGWSTLETIFPQLRESEDERIRKEMIAYFAHRADVTEFIDEGEDCKRWISYLEKQKEQKPIDYPYLPGWRKNRDNNKPELKRSVLMLTTHGVAEGEWLGEKWCQYRWSCELKDGEVLYWIHLSDLERLGKEGEEKQKEQKPAEWSEEDADILNCCISSIEEAKENRYAYKETDGDTSYDREIAFLKSLRPSWKPSEEQMDALKELIDDANRAGWVTPGATELYEQLKKL